MPGRGAVVGGHCGLYPMGVGNAAMAEETVFTETGSYTSSVAVLEKQAFCERSNVSNYDTQLTIPLATETTFC